MERRKILKQFIMTVYEDGGVELTPHDMNELPEDEYTIELTKTSSRIGQILCVLYYTIDLQRDENPIYINENVTKAMKKTAAKFQVSLSAIIDKCTRQLIENETQYSLSASDFKYYVMEYIKRGDDTLKKMLLNNVSDKSGQNDTKAIQKFFTNPEKIKLYLNHVEV